MKILKSSRKTSAYQVSDDAKSYVKDKLCKVANMIDDADDKLEDAQKLYNKTSDTEPHPESDYAEGASAAIGYAQKQLDFIDDRLDDYMDDYNLSYL